jgi:hypothetical protein
LKKELLKVFSSMVSDQHVRRLLGEEQSVINFPLLSVKFPLISVNFLLLSVNLMLLSVNFPILSVKFLKFPGRVSVNFSAVFRKLSAAFP